MLEVRGLSVEVGGRLTLTDGSFNVHPGDKVGLVGRNGAGKTSMLRVLAGERPAYAGTVKHTGALGYLTQDPLRDEHLVERTALTHVLSGRGLDEMAARMEKLRLTLEEDPSDRNIEKFTKAQETYEHAGGYQADAEVRTLLTGLGLKKDRADLPLGVLSGGERRRVELARILFAGSDLLFLDEPTNHLDVDAKTWLLAYMRSYRGSLLVISHDLDLLDEAINRVLHLDEGTLVQYKGTYSQYKTQRAADEERLGKVANMQAAEITRLERLADGMRGQTAKRAKIAKSLDKRVERLETNKVEGPSRERRYNVRLPEPPAPGRTVLEMTGISKSYGGKPPVFTGATFDMGRGDRVLVLGLNGAGKSTLLKILAGVTEPDAGTVKFGHNVSAGYFAQEHENIHAGTRVLDHVASGATGPMTTTEQRALLGMFGIQGDMANQDAGTLSGGEKTKVSLACLVAGRHNLLLLDEPTNNLDPPSRTAIGQALASWKGAMVVVSHDPEFVEMLRPQKVLLLPDATVDLWSDDFIDLIEMA